MKRNLISKAIVVALSMAMICFLAGPGVGQHSISSSLGVVPYPSQGQSLEQQNKDEGECYAWAKQQTGIDPVAVAGSPAPASGPAAGGGERVVGAATGALGGAAIGGIAGDAGEGAAIGAVVGTMAGGRQARKNRQAQQQHAQSAQAEKLQHFNKAFGACLEGRGYVVK